VFAALAFATLLLILAAMLGDEVVVESYTIPTPHGAQDYRLSDLGMILAGCGYAVGARVCVPASLFRTFLSR
jgi:hypothetical protein